jgi:hypothetical protein
MPVNRHRQLKVRRMGLKVKLSYKDNNRNGMERDLSSQVELQLQVLAVTMAVVSSRAAKSSLKVEITITKKLELQNKRLIWKTSMFNSKTTQKTLATHHNQQVQPDRSITRTNLTAAQVPRMPQSQTRL